VTNVLIHTGQHYDDNMSRVFFEEMEIPFPDCNIGVGSASHGAQTGRMLEAIEQSLLKEQPDWVVLYGDTNSTLAGALAAIKLQLRIAHVEAGLRSFDMGMPEEVNRVLTDHVSDVLFAPTVAASEHLKREGISPQKIQLVGDVMYDAALYYGPLAAQSPIVERLGLTKKRFALVTVHRPVNTDDSSRLRAIVDGLSRLATDLPVVFPIHPRTCRALLREGLMDQVSRRLHVIDAVGFLEMVELERCARLIVTDSGGVQKESFFYRVPCVSLRTETEWVELLGLGWLRLAPPSSSDAVYRACQDALHAPQGAESTPYGDGSAAVRIAHILHNWR
jgi:UDP-GlcNAc3NAcA epimerase